MTVTFPSGTLNTPTVLGSASAALPPANINLGVTTPKPPVTPTSPYVAPAATNTPTSTPTPPPPPTPPTPTTTPTPPAADTSTTDTTSQPSADQQNLKTLEDQRTKEAQDFYDKGVAVSNTITNLQNGTIPLTPGEQAQVDGLKQQWQTLLDQQIQANKNFTTGTQILAARSGVMQYAPGVYMSQVQKTISDGVNKVSDLMVKEASAVASLTQSLKDKDIGAVKDAWAAYKDASSARQTALNATIKDTQDAIKTAADAAQKAQETYYNQVTKPINDIAEAAAKNGANAQTLSAINGAKTVGEAIALGGSALQTSSNPDVAQYLFYKQQAQNAGQTPVSFDAYQAQQAQIAASQAYSKAFATAAGSAAGAASITPTVDIYNSGGGLGGTDKGQSILAVTGLSIGAFNYLTGNTSALSRLTASQRMAIMAEATNFANKNGVDVSTIISQYKSLNDVLGGNIARENNAKIKGNDVTQTVDQLIAQIAPTDAAKSSFTTGKNTGTPTPFTTGQVSGMNSLKVANIIDMAAGREVNNPFAIKYGTTIGLLTNDLAGYLAATRTSSPTGNATPDDADKREAAQLIYNGLNAGGLQAFKDTIDQNVTKIAGVSGQAVTDTQKQVWSLFGVGDKYKSPTNASDQLMQTQQQQADTINKYVTANPDKAQSIANLYTQGFTDEQVAEYLQLQ